MPTARGLRLFAAVAALAVMTACESPPPPPPPPVAEAPPPPPPPPPVAPPMALATRVIEDASTFRAYMTTAAGITADFTNADQVAAGVRTATAFEQTQLQQGAIAYVAVMALQEPTFVKTVREYAIDPTQRRKLVEQILADPGYAATFEGGDKAAGLAIASLDAMGAKVLVAGKAVKQSAYDVQRQAWSKTNVANPEARLSDTKVRSGQRILASLSDVSEIRKASLEGAAPSVAVTPVAPPYSRAVAQGMALAALAAMGEAGDDRGEIVSALLTEESSAYCLNMSKLNLYQCLAVSKPQYEDIFCLGQHSMIDIGQCVVKAAASPTPAYIEPPPPIVEPKPVKAAAVRKPVKKK